VYELTLVRHAKSSWRYGYLEDFRRPLNKRGLKDCRRVPSAMAKRLPRPDLVIASDSVRTIQTCEAVVAAMGIDGAAVRLDHSLYLADAQKLLDVVAGVELGVRRLMLVGHNPGLTDLVERLSGTPLDNVPTFGVVHLLLGQGRWTAPGEQARVTEIMLPRQL
jgi:phosphohistidine phosphatase